MFMKKNKKTLNQPESKSYFEEANDWATERYHMQSLSTHRWQLAFWCQLGFSMVLALSLLCLMPLKSWEPLIIERNLQTGEIFTHPATVDNLPKIQAEIEADLVRFVTSYETYDAADEGPRYRKVQFMSSPDVFMPYEVSHHLGNEDSFEATFGKKGTRTVRVEDVIFIDATDPRRYQSKKESKKAQRVPPIAKVDFVTTETLGQKVVIKHWVATLNFEYLGTPDNKEASWSNWSGFTVTSYRVDQRNV